MPLAANPVRNANRTKMLTRVLGALAILVLVLAYVPMHGQTLTNWLFNPGFELGTDGWSMVPPWTWNGPAYTVQSTNGYVYGSGDTVHVDVHSGTNAIKVWGYFQNYRTTPGAMQTFPAAPGSEWAAAGWACTQHPDNVKANANGSCASYLRILFLQATPTNTPLYSPPLATYYSAAITTNSATNVWFYMQATNSAGGTNLVAPPGTAFISFQIIMDQPAPYAGTYAGGSCYWDDVTLLNIGRPDPEITVQPQPQTVVYGQTATFTVQAWGKTPLSYKWQKDWADITDPNAYGVYTPTLTLSNVTTAMMGYYTVTVTDEAGSVTSDPVLLTVLDPGIISMSPAVGQTVIAGTNVTISVVAAGSTPPTYAWYKDGNPLSNDGHFSGVTTPTLAISNVTPADTSTNYQVFVSGGQVIGVNGLKVVTPEEVATNRLSNGGFEDSVFSLPWETAWVKFNGADIVSTNAYYYLSDVPVSVHNGLYVGHVYGTDADNGVYQNVTNITGGATYRAGGWFYMSQYSPLGESVYVSLSVTFRNAAGTALATYYAPRVTAAFPLDTWTYLAVTNAQGGLDLVAPPAAVSATVMVYMYNWSYGGGAVYFDDLHLTPLLPPPFAVTCSVSNGYFALSFPTMFGITYKVLHSDTLTQPLSSWSTHATLVGDGTVKTVSIPIAGANRFYTVRAGQ